jgi:hypothetical protein
MGAGRRWEGNREIEKLEINNRENAAQRSAEISRF